MGLNQIKTKLNTFSQLRFSVMVRFSDRQPRVDGSCGVGAPFEYGCVSNFVRYLSLPFQRSVAACI